MGQPAPQKPPKPPNPAKTYQQGLDVYLKYLPTLLSGEQGARTQYDPARIAEQQRLQGEFGPAQYQQQLDARQQLDPTGTALRENLGKSVSEDLSLGTQLSPEMENQLQTESRNAQIARGNAFGNAPAAEETLFQGQAARNLYEQRLANAGTFLAGRTPIQDIQGIQPVTPDRSSQYVNPNAGFLGQQFGLQNYQNQLGYNQLVNNQPNPWASALGGAAAGASAGASFGPYGAVIGGVAGAALGYFSDKKLKTNIVDLYKTKLGIPVKQFEYKDDPAQKTYIGALAQDIKKIVPDAVKKVGDFLAVDYDQIDAPMAEVLA